MRALRAPYAELHSGSFTKHWFDRIFCEITPNEMLFESIYNSENAIPTLHQSSFINCTAFGILLPVFHIRPELDLRVTQDPIKKVTTVHIYT